MKNKLKKFTLFILMLSIALSITACGSKTNEIRNLMSEFENSCNKLDLNSMLNCINPKVADGVKLATGVLGIFSDKNTDELLDDLASVLLDEAPSNAKEFFSSIEMATDDIKIDGDTATAMAEIEYKISGEAYEENAVFEYIYTDEKWYISNLDIK